MRGRFFGECGVGGIGRAERDVIEPADRAARQPPGRDDDLAVGLVLRDPVDGRPRGGLPRGEQQDAPLQNFTPRPAYGPA